MTTPLEAAFPSKLESIASLLAASYKEDLKELETRIMGMLQEKDRSAEARQSNLNTEMEGTKSIVRQLGSNSTALETRLAYLEAKVAGLVEDKNAQWQADLRAVEERLLNAIASTQPQIPRTPTPNSTKISAWQSIPPHSQEPFDHQRIYRLRHILADGAESAFKLPHINNGASLLFELAPSPEPERMFGSLVYTKKEEFRLRTKGAAEMLHGNTVPITRLEALNLEWTTLDLGSTRPFSTSGIYRIRPQSTTGRPAASTFLALCVSASSLIFEPSSPMRIFGHISASDKSHWNGVLKTELKTPASAETRFAVHSIEFAPCAWREESLDSREPFSLDDAAMFRVSVVLPDSAQWFVIANHFSAGALLFEVPSQPHRGFGKIDCSNRQNFRLVGKKDLSPLEIETEGTSGSVLSIQYFT